ncbi:MAG TPA: hypothetical protein VFI53_13610, partial [Myxococcaceae bacterium]|nr:hypothetical protein [Myxococcaceae bacterium]
MLCAVVALTGAGCATNRAVAPAFTYAPRSGTHYVRTVKVVNETTVVGSPLRQREEQEFIWNVSFAQQGSLTVVSHQLESLSVRINDARVAEVHGPTAERVSVDLLVSPGPRVVEVRGAERAATLLSSLSGGTTDSSGPVIEPEEVRKIAVALFEMVVRDVVGHATAPGSTWVTMDPDPAIARKTMKVEGLEACGAARCARVRAEYEMSSDHGGGAIRSATAFLAQTGMNPAEAEVVEASLEYHEEILLEPGTLVDHSATFSRISRVMFLSRGMQIPVEFRTTLEQ